MRQPHYGGLDCKKATGAGRAPVLQHPREELIRAPDGHADRWQSDLSTGGSLASRPATATCARVRQSAPERDCGAAAQGGQAV
jgi:hypothetical protein